MWEEEEPNCIIDGFFEWQRKSCGVARGFKNLVCISYSTALEAAKAYAKTHGIGFYIQSPYEISSGYFNIVIYVSKEYEHEDDLFDAVRYLEDYRTCVAVIREETTPTESIILENGRTSMPDESARTDSVMEQLKGNLPCEETIIISELSSPKTQFPPGCLYKPLLQNIGWSVGATIGCALAAPEKRLVTCIPDSSFQAMKGEMPTMFKICRNSIIILVNTRLYNLSVDNGYTDVIDATGKGPTELWTSKVHTKKELGIAIRKADNEEISKLCFTEVLIPEDAMDPCCGICQTQIVDEDDIVSCGSCNHIFHYNCIDKLLKNSKKECPDLSPLAGIDELLKSRNAKCPLDCSRLAGPSERWTIRAEKEVVSDHKLKVSPMLINIRPGSEIEKSCSHCNRPYCINDEKITSIECAHTYCAGCYYNFVVDKCLVCHTNCAHELWNTTTVVEGEERVPSGLTFEMINSLGETNRVREDNLEFRNVEPALVEEEEIDEVPTRDEEEIDEADAQQDLSDFMWEEGRYSGGRGVTR